MDLTQIGKLVVAAGVCVMIAGIILIIVGSTGLFGSLLQNGTIRLQSSGVTCLIPIAASIILSIILTVILNVIIRLINK